MSDVPQKPIAGWDVPANYWAADPPEDFGDENDGNPDNEDWLDMECGHDSQCSQALPLNQIPPDTSP
jgi:hypothetical protein